MLFAELGRYHYAHPSRHVSIATMDFLGFIDRENLQHGVSAPGIVTHPSGLSLKSGAAVCRPTSSSLASIARGGSK
jgi:hypothetical protein